VYSPDSKLSSRRPWQGKTTLHTNSSVASITRLIDTGIKPYIIASALEAVMAQRLVRKICGNCKTETAPDAAVPQLPGIPPERFGETTRHAPTACTCWWKTAWKK
jgi:type II secretory ATPase GspE/PulE/Tfp pilus assembly ATPase PilB-like protein